MNIINNEDISRFMGLGKEAQEMRNRQYMDTIRQVAFQRPPSAFSALLKNGDETYQIMLVRKEASRPWTNIEDLVFFGDQRFSWESREMLGCYLNSFPVAHECIEMAAHFYDKYGLKLDISELLFPLPLPFSISFLNMVGNDGPEAVIIGNNSVTPPLILQAFYFDIYGDSSEWAEKISDDDFGWKKRHGSGIHSFVIPAGEVLRDVEIRGYGEPRGKSFLDEIEGVHVKEMREIIEP